jgi:hypothetical protein
MNEVITRIVNDLPDGVKGMILIDPAGDANLYIDGRQASNIQHETYIHEVRHYGYGHLDSDKPVEVCEEEADYGL